MDVAADRMDHAPVQGSLSTDFQNCWRAEEPSAIAWSMHSAKPLDYNRSSLPDKLVVLALGLAA